MTGVTMVRPVGRLAMAAAPRRIACHLPGTRSERNTDDVTSSPTYSPICCAMVVELVRVNRCVGAGSVVVPGVDPAVTLIREPEPLGVVVVLAGLDERIPGGVHCGLVDAGHVDPGRNREAGRWRDGQRQPGTYRLHHRVRHGLEFERHRGDDAEQAEAPAAAANCVGSSTSCTSPRALTNSIATTRSLRVRCALPAPWQMVALLPPKVISTMIVLTGMVHSQSPPASDEAPDPELVVRRGRADPAQRLGHATLDDGADDGDALELVGGVDRGVDGGQVDHRRRRQHRHRAPDCPRRTGRSSCAGTRRLGRSARIGWPTRMRAAARLRRSSERRSAPGVFWTVPPQFANGSCQRNHMAEPLLSRMSGSRPSGGEGVGAVGSRSASATTFAPPAGWFGPAISRAGRMPASAGSADIHSCRSFSRVPISVPMCASRMAAMCWRNASTKPSSPTAECISSLTVRSLRVLPVVMASPRMTSGNDPTMVLCRKYVPVTESRRADRTLNRGNPSIRPGGGIRARPHTAGRGRRSPIHPAGTRHGVRSDRRIAHCRCRWDERRAGDPGRDRRRQIGAVAARRHAGDGTWHVSVAVPRP